MSDGKYVFSQLVELLPQKSIQRLLTNYGGDRYVKQFSCCWNQLLVMMFGQLYGCDRLRELVSVVTAHTRKAYHLGFGKEEIKLANLAKANANRDYRLFKWIKQHLYIKTFWGNSENAVRIQTYSAICAYCIVAIAGHDCHLNRSLFDVLRVLRGSLINNKTLIRELFEKPIDDGPEICENIGFQLSLNFL